VIPVPVSSRAYTGVTSDTGVMSENTGVTSDTCAGQQQSLHGVTIENTGVRSDTCASQQQSLHGVTIENTGVRSDTCASQQQSLVVCVDELAVCDARVPQISSRKRTQPAALLPVPHAAHMRMR